ncbi:Chromatin SPT2 [Akanthomyces lecanii RCEF 1005]|uniref:Chromatin SPT2 n=1 Tax=Akanthomyces lecanii RCEF 1005 TaxID=1081108 RepID=A0A168J6N8_CORDF|nr:Chromatin SPT2 [Akanthomyces lecanii RCEF 1005]
MPISDLLASISGGAAKNPASSRPNPPASIKRKASSDLPSTASKTQRLTPPPAKSSQTSRPGDDKAPSSGARYAGTAAGGRPPGSTARAAAPPANKPRPTSSAASSPAAAAPSRVAPKKGSFAEILARGKAAQVSMGQVGKIQHKKVENPPKRFKDEGQEGTPAAGPVARGKKPAAPGYGGTSRPFQRPSSSGAATNGNRRPGASSTLSKQRPSSTAPGSARRAAAAAPEPEKKIKKAATATTGYAGTARPKPGSDVKKRHHETPRGGALLSAPKARGAGARGSKYDDEYDEDMDDFIDYDDEEDGGVERGHGYASDGSSDMEAGMDDIYDEEDRAARIARQEDIREKQLEESLKAAKEERRRRALGYR